jgi:hypothetical protein
MEESLLTVPFSRLSKDKYLMLEVMLYVKYNYACRFMFSLSKGSRCFLIENFITIRNEFINDGYIDDIISGYLSTSFDYYMYLERNYL